MSMSDKEKAQYDQVKGDPSIMETLRGITQDANQTDANATAPEQANALPEEVYTLIFNNETEDRLNQTQFFPKAMLRRNNF